MEQDYWYLFRPLQYGFWGCRFVISPCISIPGGHERCQRRERAAHFVDQGLSGIEILQKRSREILQGVLLEQEPTERVWAYQEGLRF